MKLFNTWDKETFQKVFVVTMFTAAAVYGTCSYYVLKQYGLLGEWETSLVNHRAQIEEVEAMAATARKEARTRQQVERFVELHRGGMISGDAFAWVVREISLLAEDHPLSVTSIRPAGPATVALKNRYDGFNADVEVTGTYDQIGKFVEAIENRFVTSKITSLQLAGTEGGKHRASLQVTWLVVPEPRTIGPVDKKQATPKTEEKKPS